MENWVIVLLIVASVFVLMLPAAPGIISQWEKLEKRHLSGWVFSGWMLAIVGACVALVGHLG